MILLREIKLAVYNLPMVFAQISRRFHCDFVGNIAEDMRCRHKGCLLDCKRPFMSFILTAHALCCNTKIAIKSPIIDLKSQRKSPVVYKGDFNLAWVQAKNALKQMQACPREYNAN